METISLSLRHVLPMEKQELERLHTGSLLTRLRKLNGLHDSFDDCDWTEQERQSAAHVIELVIAFKDTEIWRQAYRDVKAVLATREHVTRGTKEQRQQAAHAKKHR